MQVQSPGFVTPEMTQLLDEKYAAWQQFEKNGNGGGSYGLLVSLMAGILEGPDPDHLAKLEAYLRTIAADKVAARIKTIKPV